jgi:aminoglycoside phosphotransferase (APT) family kinase protein
MDGWSRRHLAALIELEAAAPDAVNGDHVAHLDTRADNVLLGADRDWLVDWPWAAVGPRWLDAVVSAPAVAMQGGPAPEDYLHRSGLVGASDADSVTAVIAAFTGFLGWLASLPPPPGLPTIRPFQQAQAEIGLAWLQQRTGWS